MLYNREDADVNLTESARAKCPYYRHYAQRTIQCESCVYRTRLAFVFRNAAEAEKHKRAYCDDIYRWNNCIYAQMMTEKWSKE